jgi:anti-sigma B factor antagonist
VKNLKINERRVGKVTILDIEGNLRIGEGSAQLQQAIRRLLAEGQNQILLNLGQVAYIDSSGLGEMVAAHVATSKSGGEIKLLHLTQRVRELMTITKLVTVFESYETEAEALERYKAEETEEKEDAAVAGQGVGR